MIDLEGKNELKNLLDRLAEEDKTKILNNNCKLTECMVATKRDSTRCKLHIGDNKIK